MKSRMALLAAAAVFFGGNIAAARPGEPPPLAVADLGCFAGLSLPFGAPVMLLWSLLDVVASTKEQDQGRPGRKPELLSFSF